MSEMHRIAGAVGTRIPFQANGPRFERPTGITFGTSVSWLIAWFAARPNH